VGSADMRVIEGVEGSGATDCHLSLRVLSDWGR
jgi:hypothetical protein